MLDCSTITCITLVTTLIYLTLRYLNSYWSRRHIAFVKPLPLVGNLFELLTLKVSFGELFQRLYENPNLKNQDYGGIFILHQPALIIRSPNLIKKVLIKDFDKFLNRFEAADPVHDSIGSLCLPLAKYSIWRSSRKKMSSVFTTGKMKYRMYPLMLKMAQELENYILKLNDKASNNNWSQEIEVKEMCSLFTTDLTSILHYGVDIQGLRNGTSPLRQQTQDLFGANFLKVIHFFAIFFLPHLCTRLKAKVFTPSYSNFMRKFTLECLKQRQFKNNTNLYYNGDLLDVLRLYQKESSQEDSYIQHPDFIPSQVAIFLLAGFETSSSVMGFILYELSKYPKIQKHLRLELKQAFSKETYLSYEKLLSLNYLHQVVCEGLRMYPAAAFINRECTPSREEPKGFYLTPELFVPQGMPLYISILGLHRDSKHWPEPNTFRPERFAQSNLDTINPMTYIPFGAGPHGCIGSRLGILQVKLGLAHILKLCRVEKSSRTPKEIQFDTKSFMLQNKGGIYLKFVKD